ncbi:MAG: dihydrodipicolinate synthase family protein [Planctomycetes bacterium]|nr:dihydrodipicolinate synthase family protein [Planctomycetota bacterium]
MFIVGDYKPREGLSVPLLTALDARGEVDEESQRRLVRHAVSGGFGADILFGMGTNGEWNRLERRRRARAMAVQADEVTRVNALLRGDGHRTVELWLGISSSRRAEVVEQLRDACRFGAHAVVLAPLAVADMGDAVAFLREEVREEMDRLGRHVPLFLYDNVDLSVDPRVPHIRTRDLKKMSRIDFVRGIKVTASRKVMGNYTRAARQFNLMGSFGIYLGNPQVAFDFFDPDRAGVRRWIERVLFHYALPVGFVSGYANLWPREWQDAWLSCRHAHRERMLHYQRAFERFRALCEFTGARKTIACMKVLLSDRGILGSGAVAEGTPSLSAEETKRFLAVAGSFERDLQAPIPERWRTPFAPVASAAPIQVEKAPA